MYMLYNLLASVRTQNKTKKCSRTMTHSGPFHTCVKDNRCAYTDVLHTHTTVLMQHLRLCAKLLTL